MVRWRASIGVLASVVALAACGDAASDDDSVAGPEASATASDRFDTETASPTPTPSPSEPAPTATSAEPDAPVPSQLDFTAPTVDGATFDGASLAGKPAVLWFWAPWCPVCKREAPLIADLAARFEGDVTFVGVAGLSGDVGAINDFIASGGVGDLPHIDDRSGEIYTRFGVTQQYDLGIVTADGEVDIVRGPLSEDEIIAEVERLAAG